MKLRQTADIDNGLSSEYLMFIYLLLITHGVFMANHIIALFINVQIIFEMISTDAACVYFFF